MQQTILVHLDDSKSSERVLPAAIALATASDSQLILVRSAWAKILPGMDPIETRMQVIGEVEKYMAGIVHRLGGMGIAAETAVPYASAVHGTLLEIELRHPDLLVMCAPRHSGAGPWLHGSDAQKIIAQSPIPVLVVRENTPPIVFGNSDLEPATILVPLDGTLFGEAALAHAESLARSLHETLSLLRVIPAVRMHFSDSFSHDIYSGSEEELISKVEEKEAEDYLREISARLGKDGLRVKTLVRHGWLAETILDGAGITNANLIVMATHARFGLDAMLKGDVALEVAQLSSTPLLLVHPDGLAKPGKSAIRPARSGEKIPGLESPVGPAGTIVSQ
jgi:nucleotide-binding universal stress UspA family protein